MKFVLLEENLRGKAIMKYVLIYLLKKTIISVFAKGLQFLSRLSDVIYVESSEKELSLKSINSQKSSYGIVSFDANFFLDFTRGYDPDVSEENICKLQTKPLLKTFRNFKNVSLLSLLYKFLLINCSIQFLCLGSPSINIIGCKPVKIHS